MFNVKRCTIAGLCLLGSVGANAGISLGLDAFIGKDKGVFGDDGAEQVHAVYDWDTKLSFNGFVRLEHSFSIVPHLRFAMSNAELSGKGNYQINPNVFDGQTLFDEERVSSKLDVGSVAAYYKYYEAWPYQVDLGLSFQEINGAYTIEGVGVKEVIKTLPGFYGRFAMTHIVPKLSAEFTFNYFSLSGDHFLEADARLKYKVLNFVGMDGYAYAAYRTLQFTFDDIDNFSAEIERTGVVAGFELQF